MPVKASHLRGFFVTLPTGAALRFCGIFICQFWGRQVKSYADACSATVTFRIRRKNSIALSLQTWAGRFFRTAKREATSLLQAAGRRSVVLGSKKVQTTLLNDFSLILAILSGKQERGQATLLYVRRRKRRYALCECVCGKPSGVALLGRGISNFQKTVACFFVCGKM